MEENIYELQIPASSLKMLLKAVQFAYDKWPGGDPIEQEIYFHLKECLQRIVLEETFMLDA